MVIIIEIKKNSHKPVNLTFEPIYELINGDIFIEDHIT